MPGTRCLYLSHTAGKRSDPDWWIVEPRDDVERLADQVWSLLDCGRRVLQVAVWDEGGQVHELTDLPREMQANAVREMEFRAENGYRPLPPGETKYDQPGWVGGGPFGPDE